MVIIFCLFMLCMSCFLGSESAVGLHVVLIFHDEVILSDVTDLKVDFYSLLL